MDVLESPIRLAEAAEQLLLGCDPDTLLDEPSADRLAHAVSDQAFRQDDRTARCSAHRTLFALYELHHLPGEVAHPAAQYHPLWTRIRTILEQAWAADLERVIRLNPAEIPADPRAFRSSVGPLTRWSRGTPISTSAGWAAPPGITCPTSTA